MQTEQIVAAIIGAINLALIIWIIVILKNVFKPLSQPDNKSYNTKKRKAEIGSHGYNEVVTLTDKRNADLVKEIEDEDED